MDKKYLIENVTLTRIVKFLNEKFKMKKTGSKFTTNDVQKYIMRGYLPAYLGGNNIVESKLDSGTKLYNIEN